MLAFLRKRRPVLYVSGRFYRSDGTCSARFLPSCSLSIYAFIFIKGILLFFILCFNSLSRLPLKTRHSRRVFFTRRSSPVFMIKKILHRQMPMQDFCERATKRIQNSKRMNKQKRMIFLKMVSILIIRLKP